MGRACGTRGRRGKCRGVRISVGAEPWAGQVQGLIHDLPTVKELILRIVAEARSIIDGRLRATLSVAQP